MCFWRWKSKRVKLKYKFESIHLEEQIDSKRWWIIHYRSNPVSSAYGFMLKNIHLGKDVSLALINMIDNENMIIELKGYKQDIKDFINLLIEKDINLIKWYKITLD